MNFMKYIIRSCIGVLLISATLMQAYWVQVENFTNYLVDVDVGVIGLIGDRNFEFTVGPKDGTRGLGVPRNVNGVATAGYLTLKVIATLREKLVDEVYDAEREKYVDINPKMTEHPRMGHTTEIKFSRGRGNVDLVLCMDDQGQLVLEPREESKVCLGQREKQDK